MIRRRSSIVRFVNLIPRRPRARAAAPAWTAALACALLTSWAFACGPFFPNDYFVIGGKDPQKLIELSFYHELSKALQREDPSFISPDTDRWALIPTDVWNATLSTDAEELELALLGKTSGVTEIVGKFQELRKALRANAEKHWVEGGCIADANRAPATRNESSSTDAD